MRAWWMVLLVLLGIGLFAEPGRAGPCPLHDRGQIAEVTPARAAFDTDAVEKAAEQPSAAEFGAGHLPEADPKQHHPLFSGQLCCHGAVGFGLAVGVPLEQQQGPRRGSVFVFWQPPYASPAADIFRPPRNA